MNDSKMIKTVEDYIFQKKGIRVTINQPDTAYRKLLLQQAYAIAEINLNF